jgi:integrase
MALFKRGNFWYYDFWFEGIRYQKSTKLSDKREAEKAENAVKTDLARRKFTLPSKSLRFRELCEKYAEFAKTNGKHSYVTEKYHISNHLVPHFGEILVHAINMDTCEKYKRKRLREGAARSTINRELCTLKAILKYGAQIEVAPDGLGKHARMFADVEYKEKRVLKVEELGRLVAVCASLEFQVTARHLLPLVVVGYFEGLRPSEMTRLPKDNVDLEVGIIWVEKSKTPSGTRYIPIKKEAWEVLRSWVQKTKGKWLFPSPRKAGAHIKDFGKAFDKAVKAAGLTGITPDCLRHTFATRVKPNVRRRSDLRDMMGHSDDRHTLPYLHEELEDKRAAIEALPVPANFTTAVTNWMEQAPAKKTQVRKSQGVEMVGPWGLEPQTSTVSSDR